ncbi:hypothetical protein [Streptomyces glomeratus]|uniref:Uncharacterized protein n=1 Tax=Streptomyces glomeratus TaxID=284452 RepID=A0ABP6L5T8_9ACTN|nr:hypothetical protein [Streptomyces glomeratus]MCF1509544.1 hypothetical protein [Streptomyces glomeratus]
MPPTPGTLRLLRALRSVWRTAVDGLIMLGAYHGAVPPAHLAALIGKGARLRRDRRTPPRPAPAPTWAAPPDTLLTEAERRAWERLVERF